MLRAAQQGRLCVLIFKGMPGVFGEFKTEPPSEHHHHLSGTHLATFALDVQVSRVGEALKQRAKGAGFVQQDVLGLLFKAAVSAEQVTEISVQEAVFPNQLEHRVHEKPGLFNVAHMGCGAQKRVKLLLKSVKERIDELVFGGKVVVEIAWADGELRRDERGRYVGLAKAIEKPKGRFKDSLCCSSRRFFNHESRRRHFKKLHNIGHLNGRSTYLYFAIKIAAQKC